MDTLTAAKALLAAWDAHDKAADCGPVPESMTIAVLEAVERLRLAVQAETQQLDDWGHPYLQPKPA